jgi:hypothetical protein
VRRTLHLFERPSRALRPAAARQRRYKARQRQGEVVITVTLSPDETATLHRVGCLDLDKLEDRAAIAEALHLVLANILER